MSNNKQNNEKKKDTTLAGGKSSGRFALPEPLKKHPCLRKAESALKATQSPERNVFYDFEIQNQMEKITDTMIALQEELTKLRNAIYWHNPGAGRG